VTVIVGFVGADCAVMASDTEGTESGHTRHDVEKIWTAGGLLLGFSGNVGTRQALETSIESKIEALPDDLRGPTCNRWTARSALLDATGDVCRHVYGAYVQADPSDPRDKAKVAVGGVLLVIGRDDNGYWLLEIDQNPAATFYEARGFQAIGSGGSAAFVAHGLMSHYEPAGRPLDALKVIAFRTVQNCIDVLGGALGVGGHVELWSCRGGEYTRSDAEDLAVVAQGLEQWETIERESLGSTQPEAAEVAPEGEDGPPEALEE
jgi:20S proteasome alpha/beta subunit